MACRHVCPCPCKCQLSCACTHRRVGAHCSLVFRLVALSNVERRSPPTEGEAARGTAPRTDCTLWRLGSRTVTTVTLADST